MFFIGLVFSFWKNSIFIRRKKTGQQAGNEAFELAADAGIQGPGSVGVRTRWFHPPGIEKTGSGLKC
jgi:hypothetical protein